MHVTLDFHPCNNTIYTFEYSKVDYNGVCQHLNNSNINSCLQCNDIELIWQIIKEALYEAMDLFVPKVRLKAKQFPKWFTPDI